MVSGKIGEALVIAHITLQWRLQFTAGLSLNPDIFAACLGTTASYGQ